jgi:hypothetical protein
MTIRTKEMDVTLATQLIAGIKQHLSSVSSLTVDGTPYTVAQVEGFLQALIDLRTAVDDAKSSTKAKLATEAAQAPALRSQMAALVAIVKGMFASQPDVLADFGLKPKKAKPPLTIGQMADAAAKRAATRAARHTMGPKQKQKVKGTITTIVTPPAAAAPTPTAPAPVVTAPNPGAPTTSTGSSPVANASPTPPSVAGASGVAAPHAS